MRKGPPTGIIRHDESGDLLNSLEHCLLTFNLAKGDARNWKWCVTAAFSAAQIAMVIVLRGDLKHLQPESRKKVREFLDKFETPEATRYPSDVKLNSFKWLVENVWPTLEQQKATPGLKHALLRLESLRDGWTHFGHFDSSVDVSLPREVARAALTLITNLPLPPTHILFGSLSDEARYEVAISSLLKLIAAETLDDERTRGWKLPTEF